MKLFLGSVDLSVKNVSVAHRGNSKNDPATQVAGFTAQVTIPSHPGRVSTGWASVACKSAEVKNVDHCTGKSLEDGPGFLKPRDASSLKWSPASPCVLRASLTILLWAILVFVT